MMISPNQEWILTFCGGYIVPPCRGMELAEVTNLVVGSQIPIDQIPDNYFYPLFLNSTNEYLVDIAFTPENGQQNTVRTLVREVAWGDDGQRENAAHQLAVSLAWATLSHLRSGLLVILTGTNNENHRVVIWKFPADNALRAQVRREGMNIEFLSNAFSSESKYWKAAVFEGTQADTSFWEGKISDDQMKSKTKPYADYWVFGFLNSRPRMTNVEGSRLLAKVLKDTIGKTYLIDQKEALINAAGVIKHQQDTRISLRIFADTYLPEESRDVFINIAGDEIADDVFDIEEEVLNREFRYKSIFIEEDFMIRGPLDEFDDFVNIRDTNRENIKSISMEGRITSEDIRIR